MQKHSFKFDRQSIIHHDNIEIPVVIYKCRHCRKYFIINSKTNERVNLNNQIGIEVE
jgi:hypothetical protein